MKPVKSDVFRSYDIRGVVDQDFDPEWVQMLGKACGTYFLQNGYSQAVVGRDCRHSSPQYQEMIIRGLTSTGVDVVSLPMAPTPIFYFAVKHLDRRAGVMITASHNPPNFNGFKVWAGDNTIHTQEIQEIYQIMKSKDFKQGRGVASEFDILPAYLEELGAQINLGDHIKVVVDGGNGSAGEVCSSLLKNVGAEVVDLYCEPDPNFPNHHPDPTVEENLQDLRDKVQSENAHLGVGLDGDGDRIGVVNENGDILYGDQLLGIYAREVLTKNPQAMVVGEVKCSHLLFQYIKNQGGNPLMWKTGHSLIKAKMRQSGALLAGEMSGHMFFADRYYGFDDAIYAALRLVEILSQNPARPLSSYLEDWPQTFNTPEIRVDCPDEIKFRVLEKAREYFSNHIQNAKLVDVDGVRLNFKDGWGLLRASNTQPVLVLRFEAQTQKRLQEIRALFESPLREWINELSN